MASSKNNRADGAKMRRDSDMRGRRKVCVFHGERNGDINYKDVNKLKRYISERSKILPRGIIGSCARHQRTLTMAIKRTHHTTSMPYAMG